jgi:hypothetical protein
MLRAAAAALLLVIAATDATFAQPRIPSSAMPGREREQLFDPLSPPVPRIELRDGRPAPVFEIGKQRRPAKRKRCRSGRRC